MTTVGVVRTEQEGQRCRLVRLVFAFGRLDVSGVRTISSRRNEGQNGARARRGKREHRGTKSALRDVDKRSAALESHTRKQIAESHSKMTVLRVHFEEINRDRGRNSTK